MTSDGCDNGKKTLFSSLVGTSPSVQLESKMEDTQMTAEELSRERVGREIDDRFREALHRRETSGDFVVLDKERREIVDALPSKSIFDF